MNSIENTEKKLKLSQNKDRGQFLEILMRNQVKVEISNHAIFLNVNKPLLGNLIERPFTIKGLSWKSQKCAKIEHICLRKNS